MLVLLYNFMAPVLCPLQWEISVSTEHGGGLPSGVGSVATDEESLDIMG